MPKPSLIRQNVPPRTQEAPRCRAAVAKTLRTLRCGRSIDLRQKNETTQCVPPALRSASGSELFIRHSRMHKFRIPWEHACPVIGPQLTTSWKTKHSNFQETVKPRGAKRSRRASRSVAERRRAPQERRGSAAGTSQERRGSVEGASQSNACRET